MGHSTALRPQRAGTLEACPGLRGDLPGGWPRHGAWCPPAWGARLAPAEPQQQGSGEGASACQVPRGANSKQGPVLAHGVAHESHPHCPARLRAGSSYRLPLLAGKGRIYQRGQACLGHPGSSPGHPITAPHHATGPSDPGSLPKRGRGGRGHPAWTGSVTGSRTLSSHPGPQPGGRSRR